MIHKVVRVLDSATYSGFRDVVRYTKRFRITYKDKLFDLVVLDTSEENCIVVFAHETNDPTKKYEFKFTRQNQNFC